MAKVTTERLRELPVGKMLIAALPDAKAINTAKALAYRLQHELGCRFECKSDYRECVITITKKP